MEDEQRIVENDNPIVINSEKKLKDISKNAKSRKRN